MRWSIQKSENFDASLARFAGKYGATREQLEQSVADFILHKLAQPAVPYPSSADKPSGEGPAGSAARAAYRKNNVHHCHLDYENADPMIAYRIVPEQKRIILLAITDHQEMFRSDAFVRGNQGSLPKSKLRKA
jgi:hypothetical protein